MNASAQHESRMDFRSDTVTRPTAGMYQAMIEAPLGDDVYGDDPTVNALEARVADMLDKEAALFVTSGTQSNLIALMTHLRRGEEFLSGETYHVIGHEAGGSSALGGVIASGLPEAANGQILVADMQAAIKEDDPHYPITRLLSLENTIRGRVQPLSYMASLASAARSHGLSLHLDGARLMNAVIASGTPVSDYAALFDTVSLCLSKGLGAPFGSVLSGPAEFIKHARRLRKMVGGGLRQSGMAAAAGLYALDYHVERLAEDHRRARQLADALTSIEGAHVNLDMVETNMVFLNLPDGRGASLKSALADQGITISGPDIYNDNASFRLVTHLDCDDESIEKLADAIYAFLRK